MYNGIAIEDLAKEAKRKWLAQQKEMKNVQGHGRK